MSVTGMELRDIEYFAVVAEHGHLGRAAESLGLSQSALSKSLRRLEGSVEAKLIKRTSKGVELTDEGLTLLSRVRPLRLALSDVAREVSDLGKGRVGHLRIGVSPGIDFDPLPLACATLLKEAPRVTLKTGSLFLRLHLIASSGLLTLTSRRLVRRLSPQFPMVVIPVKELTWTRHVGVSYRKDAYLSPVARRFIEILKSTARETGK